MSLNLHFECSMDASTVMDFLQEQQFYNYMEVQQLTIVPTPEAARLVHVKGFQGLTKCQGHHHTGNDQVPPIKTSSSVVEAVKLMAWRQAKSPLKFPA